MQFTNDWLGERVKIMPGHMALIGEYAQMEFESAYGDINETVADWCMNLTELGIKKDSKVAALLPNDAMYVRLIFALLRLGAVLVPLNIRLTDEEIQQQYADAGCELLVVNSKRLIQSVNCVTGDRLDKFRMDSQSFLSGTVDLNATQAIVFTSGTSGKSKGVKITFGNHFCSAMASAYRLGLNPNDRWLSVLPLYHVGGLAVIFRSTLYGITTVLHDRFDIDRIQYSFDHHNITIISLVPTMLYRMIEAGVRFPDSLRLILLGGAAASPELLQRAFDMGLPIAPTYGLTEASSQVATMRPDDARKKPGSVGKPLLFTFVRIADENGNDVPNGEYGEVLVKGPTVMKGYYRNEEANAKTLRDGWLHTGDIGYLDHDGDLFLVQRRSDLIVSGGENVYPAEVEQVLRQHPAVQEVSIVGVDSVEWGQQVAAAVVLAEDMTLTEEELIVYSREHLAGYKQPRKILFVGELPQTASGKIQRDKVKALFDSSK